MGGDGGIDTLEGILEIRPDENETDFMNMLYDGVKLNKKKLDECIQKYLDRSWTLERIAKVDHAILLIAAFELLFTEMSDSIVINEAIELANTYSGEKSGAFVNGVLGSISRSKSDA